MCSTIGDSVRRIQDSVRIVDSGLASMTGVKQFTIISYNMHRFDFNSQRINGASRSHVRLISLWVT